MKTIKSLQRIISKTPRWAQPIVGIVFAVLVIVTSVVWAPLLAGQAFFDAIRDD